MAVTGIVLVLFVLGHMLGNLTVYQGPETINAYAAWLQGHPLLWVFRIVMLGVVVLHIGLGLTLAAENRLSRPERYTRKQVVAATWFSRSMAASGVVVLLFLLYHLAHLTLHGVGPEAQFEADGRMDVYANLVLGFSNPWIAWGYILAVALLGMHLTHAIQSMFQTLGMTHENWEGAIRLLSPVLAWTIALGFISIPLAVQLGWVTLAAGGAA